MTIAVGRAPSRGWFDVLDDWLKRDRFVFVGWSGILLFPIISLRFPRIRRLADRYNLCHLLVHPRTSFLLPRRS